MRRRVQRESPHPPCRQQKLQQGQAQEPHRCSSTNSVERPLQPAAQRLQPFYSSTSRRIGSAGGWRRRRLVLRLHLSSTSHTPFATSASRLSGNARAGSTPYRTFHTTFGQFPLARCTRAWHASMLSRIWQQFCAASSHHQHRLWLQYHRIVQHNRHFLSELSWLPLAACACRCMPCCTWLPRPSSAPTSCAN